MTITIFDNNKGIIRGRDQHKIVSTFGGVLQIGDDRINIPPKTKIDLPILCNGYTGEVDAIFFCDTGCTHELLKVHLDNGMIVTPPIEYENLARDYKSVGALSRRIEEATKALEELNNQNKKRSSFG